MFWFKRKVRNRRLGREYVLDVKLRSSQVRAMRARMAAVALGAVFATVFGIYIVWRAGDWALNELVYHNPAFAIKEIEAETDGVIAIDQLRRWSGVKMGDNLLGLDLARVKRDLELVPIVQSAAVERILPHRLRIRVIEREPIARLNLPRRGVGGQIEAALFLLDGNGWVMLPLEPRQRSGSAPVPEDSLPVITGVNPNAVQTGRRIESPAVQAALALVTAFDLSPMAGLLDLKSIDVSFPEILVVATGQGGEVTFAQSNLEQQLRRWREIFDSGQKNSKSIATLDLAVSNNIPVRWLDASAAAAPAPKPAKPLRNKKKHV